MSDKKLVYLGIDPGKKGALVVLYSDSLHFDSYITPTIGKEYDRQKVVEILKNINFNNKIILAGIEDINSHAAKGRQSAFIMGMGKEMWISMLTALNIPYNMINPIRWQKDMLRGIPKQKNKKIQSLIAACQLYDKNKFILGKMSKPHDGVVDALLIARHISKL